MSESTGSTAGGAPGSAGRSAVTVVVWAWVGVPFLYGLYSLVVKIPAFFVN